MSAVLPGGKVDSEDDRQALVVAYATALIASIGAVVEGQQVQAAVADHEMVAVIRQVSKARSQPASLQRSR